MHRIYARERDSRSPLPLNRRLPRRHRGSLIAAGVLAFLAASHPLHGQSLLKIHHINVTFGDATLIEFPDGTKWLIDQGDVGTSGTLVHAYLAGHGVTSLQTIAASHFHEDHIGGIAAVLTSPISYSTAAYEHLGAKAPADDSATARWDAATTNPMRSTPFRGQTWNFGGVEVQCVCIGDTTTSSNVLFDGTTVGGLGTNENSYSMGFRISWNGFDYLTLGDLTAGVENVLGPKISSHNFDVLKVSHHGSTSSTSAAFCQAIRPEVAVVSVGAGNYFGHPAQATLNNLNTAGVNWIYVTEQGTGTPGSAANMSYLNDDILITYNAVTNQYTVQGGSTNNLYVADEGAAGADSDGDGIPDSIEDANGNGVYDGGDPSNLHSADTDGDGIPDGTEDTNRNGQIGGDADGDRVLDSSETWTETNPASADSDGDGLNDGVEDANRNGVVDAGETDPRNPDTDGDGIRDGQEAAYGADPLDPDTDNDTYKDGIEVKFGSNPASAASQPAIPTPAGDADIIVNEFLADVPQDAEAGDVNGDGTRSTSQDEFIELVNISSIYLNISGYRLHDASATTIRFTFPSSPFKTIVPPGEAVVVFGGGTVANFGGNFGNCRKNGLLFAASSGLSLNDTGDTIQFKNPSGVDAITDIVYGSGKPAPAPADQSSTRSPDLTGSFIAHSNAAGSGGALFSPGTMLDGEPFAVRWVLPLRFNFQPSSSSAVGFYPDTGGSYNSLDQYGWR